MKSNTKIVIVIFSIVVVVTAIVVGVVLSSGGDSNENNNVEGSTATDNEDGEKGRTVLDDAEVVDTSSIVLECPTEFETPFSFTPGEDDTAADGSTTHTLLSMGIKISQPDTLCTLVEVSSDGKFLKPIARSYLGQDWEVSAGKYAGLLKIDCSNNEEAACTIELPSSSSSDVTDRTTVYQLTTFENPKYTNLDIVARFLEQTTFGVTKEDLDAFGDGSSTTESLNVQFGKWIQDQQDPTVTPIQSHREFYRRHLNARFEVNSPVGPTTQPCQAGTRYRWTAFSIKDSEKFVNFKTTNANTPFNTDDDKIVLSVDNRVRTVVNAPVYGFNDEDGLAEVDWPDGNYRICFVFDYDEGDDGEGDSVLLVDHPELGACQPVIFNLRSEFEYYSNPPIDFGDDKDIGVDLGDTVILDIPTASAEYIDTEYFQNYDPQQRELILTQDLTDDVNCDDIDPKSNDPVFALFDGQYWIHDPRFTLVDNTLENPLPDGGGGFVETYANNYDPEFTTMCSNVPRTFVNEDSCYLSFEPNACSYTIGEEDFERFNDPEAYFTVNHESIRAIYNVTSMPTSTTGTRYLYAIDGLDITKDPNVEPPCTLNSRSRWIPIECSGIGLDQGITFTTQRLLANLIAYFQEENENTYMVDIYHVEGLAATCADQDMNKVGLEIPDLNSDFCWKNVHPDHWNVYDFTYWTTAHPGNINGRNPIKEFADEESSSFLQFPDWHELSRWQTNKDSFLGPIRLGDRVHYFELPYELISEELAIALGIEFSYDGENEDDSSGNENMGTIVCGSPYEVANQPFLGGSVGRGAFDVVTDRFQTSFENLFTQKQVVWTNVVMNSQDQLRQRVAWALSQILVISPNSINEGRLVTESFLVYYDIFVRHAFGNYRDVLKEVSYSRLMAEMLTFYGGRSTGYVWEYEGNLEYADENYAREIMQLFTTGLFLLNKDGTEILDSEGVHERVYTNDDIEEYARVWTGFLSHVRRGNSENFEENPIDPMFIDAEYRDRFPKMGLDGKYIGDGYPLCSDLPEKHFLSKGARYRLLGASPKPELHIDPTEWRRDDTSEYMTLSASSELYDALCSPRSNGACSYPVKVVLPTKLACFSGSDECSIDTLRTVKVGELYYEYIRPACTHQAFYNDAKMIVRRWEWEHIMCGDPRMEIATLACCDENLPWEEWTWDEAYNGERTTFATANQRCSGNLCTRDNAPSCDEDTIGTSCYDNDFHWTNLDCDLGVLIDTNGKIAIAHLPDDVEQEHVDSLVSLDDPKTFFRVEWQGDYTEILSGCDSIQSCRSLPDGRCGCLVSVADTRAFESIPASHEELLSTLSIGAFELDSSPDQIVNGIAVHGLGSGGTLTADTVFEVFDVNGVRHFLKNTQSTVTVNGMSIGFRNMPHFINLSDEEPRDAQYESNAALDHYLYHPNTAPFLAIRFAQRFGISNPSPRYVETIASAFQSGVYEFADAGSTITYGSGIYGDLGATVAAVLLDREARAVILDADLSHGALKEPLLKVLGLMRSLGLELEENEPWIELGLRFGDQIGQMAHQIPNVFSFFLPEYQSSGPVAQGSLVAPEAQLLTGPRIISSLNGIFSMIRYGLNQCFGGFAGFDRERNNAECRFIAGEDYDGPYGVGRLSYKPTDGATPSEIVDELATLMTSGRLSEESRRIIEEAATNESETDFVESAQLLIATTPEFHATNVVKKSGEERKVDPPPVPSTRPYKAVVYVLLGGGYDSYNMLAPHSCAEVNSNGQTLLEQYINERTTIAITDEERSRVIDATGQPCDQFAVHEDLPLVERLYNEGDLSFFANTGALDVPVDKDNYYMLTRTELFAHNTMQLEAQRMDPWDTAPGTGILGRMTDTLSDRGFTPQPITVNDATVATVGVPGESISPLIVSARGLDRFDVKPPREPLDVVDYVGSLNAGTKLHSSVFGETWSQKIVEAISDSEQLVDSLENVELTQDYNDGGGDYMGKIGAVSSLILTHEDRGTDRDVIFVEMGGWDHHTQLKTSLSTEFQQLNTALEAFEAEMKAQNLWDQVTLVVASEFARTLTANSGEGSDHAWGGNYIVMGGDVKGGQIHGDYPSDITTNGPLNIGRGRLIPTLSWESMFNPILQWMGIESDEDLDYCMPNRVGTGTTLYSVDDVYNVDSSARSRRTLRG